MARSSRFEPETVAPAEIDRDIARRDKQEVTAPTRSQGETDVHYGKRFAETEAILKARAEERAAAEAQEGSAAPDEHLGSTDAQVSPTPAQPSTGAVASETGMPGMARDARRKPRDRRRSARTARDDTPPLGSMP